MPAFSNYKNRGFNTMPDVTSQEFIVDGQLRDRFDGVSRESYEHFGQAVWTYATAPFERWFDIDNDGWIDHGRRPENDGSWSTWNGFGWENDRNPGPPSEWPGMTEREPENNGMVVLLEDGAVYTSFSAEIENSNHQKNFGANDPVDIFHQDWNFL